MSIEVQFVNFRLSWRYPFVVLSNLLVTMNFYYEFDYSGSLFSSESFECSC